MKSRNLVAFLIMLVMVVVALAWGAQKGWSGEREDVKATYASLQEMLKTRVETANNILTVANRHLKSTDPLLTALKADRDVLSRENAALAEKAKANDQLTTDAQAVLDQLQTLESVKNDSRDSMYVSALLPQMLSDSQAYVAQNEYNNAAQAFNERMQKNFLSGALARLMGIGRAQEFSVN